MESATSKYIKPWYKIIFRFSDEVRKYLIKGKSVKQAIQDFPAYYHYNREMHSPYEKQLPWLTHGACERLRELVKPGMKVLEFGMGGSTLFFSKLGAEVTSIEHDEDWFNLVKDNLSQSGGIELNLVVPEVNDESIPEKYKSVNGLFSEGLTWRAYAHSADHLEKSSIDVLLIDGRVRPECLRNTIHTLKPGGILIFDNSDRESYKPVIKELLQGWEKETSSGVTVYDWQFNETSIFFKPTDN